MTRRHLPTRPESAPGRSRRRRLLGAAGAGALAVGAAGVGGFAYGRDDRGARSADGRRPGRRTPSTGATRPASSPRPRTGCTSPRSTSPPTPATRWSRCSRSGRPRPRADDQRASRSASGAPTPYDAPPTDTGEALGLSASGLTLTFGFGPTLFEKDGKDRFGLEDRQPAAAPASCRTSRPTTSTPQRSNGDLCVQACAHDPQVAVHAIRNLARIGFGTVAMRWAQLGFGRTSSTSTQQATAAQPARLQGRHRQPQGRGRRRTSRSSSGSPRATTPAPTGWPTAPTSSPAGSTCTSSPGTAPACASRRR